jgi:hypothetical protein
MAPRHRRGRRRRPPCPKNELPTTRHRDGRPSENPQPPQPHVPHDDGNPACCSCRREHRPVNRPPLASQLGCVLRGVGGLLVGVAAVMQSDVIIRLWQVLLP